MTDEGARPAFYALAPGGWRDYVTLLHPPYTIWHLSYVTIGAAIAPEWRPARLGWTLVAFGLALGVGAHALDELNGRPLATRIPDRVLWVLAISSIGAAVAIGIGAALAWTLWLLPFVAFGGFIVFAYNLELLGGRLHNGFWLAVAWGAFPVLTAYLASAERLRLDALAAATFAAVAIAAQRVLSTPVRLLRRQVVSVSGSLALRDGSSQEITRETLVAAPETALRLLSAAMPALAIALVLVRAT